MLMYDILIRGGSIVDGSGLEPFPATSLSKTATLQPLET